VAYKIPAYTARVKTSRTLTVTYIQINVTKLQRAFFCYKEKVEYRRGVNESKKEDKQATAVTQGSCDHRH